MQIESTDSLPQTPADRKRSLNILARSLYKELTAQGYEQTHIVALATALLGEVTTSKSAS